MPHTLEGYFAGKVCSRKRQQAIVRAGYWQPDAAFDAHLHRRVRGAVYIGRRDAREGAKHEVLLRITRYRFILCRVDR